VAYHLTKLGWRDVVLLERKDLTCGTTWHAAGLAESGLFASAVKSDMAKYTQELFQRLGEETGQDTGFRRIGYLELASTEEWVEGFRRVADFGRNYLLLRSKECGRCSKLMICWPGSIARMMPASTRWM
jgi:4-methylaminobutanoate oxidase (formaldehyde-forming)